MKNNWKRIILDVVMILVVSSLYSKNVISLAYHEIMGLSLSALFLLHLIWNRRWIASVSSRFLNQKLPGRTRFSAFLDVLLVLCWCLVIVTGILISKKLFTFRFSGIWIRMHFFFAAFSLILTGVHLGMHSGYLANASKNLFAFRKNIPRSVAGMILVCILAFGCYSLTSLDMARWISAPFIQTQEHGTERNGVGYSHETTENEMARKSNGKNVFVLILQTGSVLYLIHTVTGWTDSRLQKVHGN